jgi:hypothetical protein
VAKRSAVLLRFVLAGASSGAQISGSELGRSEPDLKASHDGSSLICSQPAAIEVPRPLLGRAKLKARRATILRDSLYDDAKGIFSIAQEKEIKRPASKLKIHGYVFKRRKETAHNVNADKIA